MFEEIFKAYKNIIIKTYPEIIQDLLKLNDETKCIEEFLQSVHGADIYVADALSPIILNKYFVEHMSLEEIKQEIDFISEKRIEEIFNEGVIYCQWVRQFLRI